jgi:hypothetical protein
MAIEDLIATSGRAAPPTIDVAGGVKQALGIKQAIQADSEADRMLDVGAKVREAYTQADTATPEGRGALVGRLYSIDPAQAQAAAKQFADADKTKAEAANLHAQAIAHFSKGKLDDVMATGEKAKQSGDIMSSMLMFARQNPDKPEAIQAQWDQTVQLLHAKGLISDQDLGGIPHTYDPSFVESKVAANATFQSALKSVADTKHLEALAAQERAKADQDKVITQKTQAEIDAGKPAADVALTKAQTADANARVGLITAQTADTKSKTERRSQVLTLAEKGNIDDNTANFIAEQYANGDKTVTMKLKAPDLAKVMSIVAGQYKPGDLAATQASAAADQRALKMLAPQIEQRRMNEKQADYQADIVLKKVSDTALQTAIPLINKGIQWGQKQLGGSDGMVLDNAVSSFLAEYAKVITGKNNVAVADYKDAQHRLEAASSPQQFRDVIGLLQREMKAANEASFQSQREIEDRIKNRKAPSASTSTPSSGPKPSLDSIFSGGK